MFALQIEKNFMGENINRRAVYIGLST